MPLLTQRLDKFLSEHCNLAKKHIRIILAQKKVLVDGSVAFGIEQRVNRFSKIEVDGKVVQNNPTYYVMLHKPVGVVCATKDDRHQTVIDILDLPFKHELHIVGRLDLNTSGLVLLTNDSRWSEAITQPREKIEKIYQVTLENPIDDSYIVGFEQGMYFDYEKITTQPAKLRILAKYQAEVTLTEGKYHQIKRMFGRYRNPVIALHRSQIGNLELDRDLAIGQSRPLTESEINQFKN